MAAPASWLACDAVGADLARLGPLLMGCAGGDDPRMAALTRHLLAGGGKRLRPALLLLARGDALAARPADATALDAAAAVELIHVASLYHDDVMDRSPTRRGAASAHSRWGNGAAALAGTWLFARAQQLLRPAGPAAAPAAARTAAALCAGQLREAENAYNLELGVDEHLTILHDKTATLFMLAAELGATLGGRSAPECAALASYAASLGLAFQLADDLLDWTGAAATLGKATGADLRGGVYNLPLLTALAAPGSEAQALRLILHKRAPDEADLARVQAIVLASGVAPVRRRAAALAAQAGAALGALAQGPVRSSLAALAALSVARQA
ncbi:polyprenyl synthetase family protein [Massilia atriviolacea]|uniref:Polyprenyl synthetase family protein n=1 Tax=Massilia atriviolacea TaxID=2495579 RepID=A0A430HTB7_9BURK|nr:polyprenyl synthetase family protein [Massilia atriviolacea]RSZ60742.1 polyprenyl synthetase family protein [Massilia atriviolacea]